MSDCDHEMCPFWSGDGCVCSVVDIERPEPACHGCGRDHIREDCPNRDEVPS